MADLDSWVGKDKIVVQTAVDVYRSDFYLVNLKDGSVSKLAGGLFYHGLSGNTVVLNSAIYAIGSLEGIAGFRKMILRTPDGYDSVYDHIHTGVSILDLKESPPRWDSCLDTNLPRSYPYCATLRGKIYAFDGSKTGNPIGEVYDPKKGNWIGIAPPSVDDGPDWSSSPKNISFPVISDPDNNRLLVHFGIIKALYAYYPDNIFGHKWKLLDKDIRFPGGDPAEVVNGVIYFFIYDGIHGSIRAYDILSKKCLKVSWTTFFNNTSMRLYNKKRMFHLGSGILCLADSYRRNKEIIFEFNRFRVDRINPGEVQVTPISDLPISVQGDALAASFFPL